jgi:DNA-binding FadR family transcriptional regulator
MRECCPPGRGCNASGGGEPCALELFRAAAEREPQAAHALARWRELQQASDPSHTRADRRFHRRVYERARETALVALLMHDGMRLAS